MYTKLAKPVTAPPFAPTTTKLQLEIRKIIVSRARQKPNRLMASGLTRWLDMLDKPWKYAATVELQNKIREQLTAVLLRSEPITDQPQKYNVDQIPQILTAYPLLSQPQAGGSGRIPLTPELVAAPGFLALVRAEIRSKLAKGHKRDQSSDYISKAALAEITEVDPTQLLSLLNDNQPKISLEKILTLLACVRTARPLSFVPAELIMTSGTTCRDWQPHEQCLRQKFLNSHQELNPDLLEPKKLSEVAYAKAQYFLQTHTRKELANGAHVSTMLIYRWFNGTPVSAASLLRIFEFLYELEETEDDLASAE